MKRLFKWFGAEKGKGAGFSFLSAGNLLIALITYLRFAEIARIFGTTWMTDAVAIAMVVPLLLQQLVSTAFSLSFIPIYSRVKHEKGTEAANRLVSRIISWMCLSGVLVLGLTLARSSFFVRIVGPGSEARIIDLASNLIRIFLPLVFLNAIEGVLQNFLNYDNRYGLVSLVRVVQVLISYLGLLIWHRELGIYVIPVSGLLGAAVSLSICGVMAFMNRLKFYLVLDPRDRDFRELLRLAMPVTIGTMTGFLGPVADKILASFMETSNVTAIDYASRIRNLVRIVLIQPVMVISTVSFSKIAARADLTRLKSELAGFIRFISYYTVPISGILVVLATPIISVLFQRGNFGPDESRLVGYALAFYSPWFAQFGIGLIMRRAFFSLKNSVVPVFLGIWAMIVNVLLNFIFFESLGIGGLALATTISSMAKTLLLAYFLRKQLGGLNWSEFLPEYLRAMAGTFVLIAYIILTAGVFPVDLGASLGSRVTALSLRVFPAVVLYVVSTALMGSTAYRKIRDSISGRFRSSRR